MAPSVMQLNHALLIFVCWRLVGCARAAMSGNETELKRKRRKGIWFVKELKDLTRSKRAR